LHERARRAPGKPPRDQERRNFNQLVISRADRRDGDSAVRNLRLKFLDALDKPRVNRHHKVYPPGSHSLGEFPLDVVRIECERCSRFGSYRP